MGECAGVWGRGWGWRALESCPDRGIRKPTYAVRALCAVPSQPLGPMQPKVERALHMRTTRQGIVPPPQKKKRRQRDRKEDDDRLASRSGCSYSRSWRPGQKPFKKYKTHKILNTRALDSQQAFGIEGQAHRTPLQSPSPAAQRHYLVDRPHASCWPQVDFHLSLLDMLRATSIGLARLS